MEPEIGRRSGQAVRPEVLAESREAWMISPTCATCACGNNRLRKVGEDAAEILECFPVPPMRSSDAGTKLKRGCAWPDNGGRGRD